MPPAIYVFYDRSNRDHHYKVGFHSGPFEELYKRYQTSVPNIEFVLFRECDNAADIEKQVLAHFYDCRDPHKTGKPSEFIECDLYKIMQFIDEQTYGKMAKMYEEKAYLLANLQNKLCNITSDISSHMMKDYSKSSSINQEKPLLPYIPVTPKKSLAPIITSIPKIENSIPKIENHPVLPSPSTLYTGTNQSIMTPEVIPIILNNVPAPMETPRTQLTRYGDLSKAQNVIVSRGPKGGVKTINYEIEGKSYNFVSDTAKRVLELIEKQNIQITSKSY